MKQFALLSLATSTLLFGGGYKIPEVSLKGTALSAAYIANAHGSDASYYNPANMVFNAGGRSVEADLTYINLSEIDFTGSAPSPSGIDTSGSTSGTEHFLVPSLHYVSDDMGGWRYGFSLVVPGGLSKRWNDQPGRTYAHEFTLQVVELNPTVAYRVNDRFAIGGGLRVVHSSGIVKSASLASRDLEGDSIDWGFNLAATYKPMPELSLAATYRSNVDLSVEGDAKLYFPDNGNYTGPRVFSGDADVEVPLPAALNLAAAYTFDSIRTTVELVYERTFWSEYETLDFNYETSIGALTQNFDDPIPKAWDDTDALRLGVTKAYGEWTAMAAVAYDESPVPEHTLNFELPDSDAWILSAGATYRYSPSLTLGAAMLVDLKESRTIRGTVNDNMIDGKFENARAFLLSLGAEYTF